MSRLSCGAMAIAMAVLLAETSSAQAQSRTQAGRLLCRMGPSVGVIIGSRQRIACRFTPSGGGRAENYSGTITRFGLDVGFTAGGVMRWTVLARKRETLDVGNLPADTLVPAAMCPSASAVVPMP